MENNISSKYINSFFGKKQKEQLENYQASMRMLKQNEAEFDEVSKHLSGMFFDEYFDGDYRTPSYGYDCRLTFTTGKNSHIVAKHYDVSWLKRSGKEYNGIEVNVYGQKLWLPKETNLQDVIKAVSLYDYAITQLKSMKIEEAKVSPLYQLKIDIENSLKAVAKGSETKINIPANNVDFATLQDWCQADALVKGKVEAGVIPAESLLRKYPRNLALLEKKLPKVELKQKVKQIKQNKKAIIKKEKRELKLAKKMEREKARKALKEEINKAQQPGFDNSQEM